MNSLFFFFNDTATTEIYTLSLHDALPISSLRNFATKRGRSGLGPTTLISPFKTLKNWGNSSRLVLRRRSEEHTSELQSQSNLVCRLLLEKKKYIKTRNNS